MSRHHSTNDRHGSGAARAAAWVPGLAVGIGAGIATAHGLFEVAVAAGTPVEIAALYPLITDGLALAAYAATTRLAGNGRRYAWAVVVLAAGLSGLAQATYLAGGVEAVPPAVRFGVGAWPAIAAAIVAHLLFLLGAGGRHETPQPADSATAHALPHPSAPSVDLQPSGAPTATVRPAEAVSERPEPEAVERSAEHLVVRERIERSGERAPVRPYAVERSDVQGAVQGRTGPAVEQARRTAVRHRATHGELPSVRRLAALAGVGQGTAQAALNDLRRQPGGLHVVNDTDDPRSQP